MVARTRDAIEVEVEDVEEVKRKRRVDQLELYRSLFWFLLAGFVCWTIIVYGMFNERVEADLNEQRAQRVFEARQRCAAEIHERAFKQDFTVRQMLINQIPFVCSNTEPDKKR